MVPAHHTDSFLPSRSARRWRLLIVLLLVMVAFIALVRAYPWPKMEYVPTEDQIRATDYSALFAPAGGPLRGIYGNADLPSIVFEYDALEGGKSFWTQLNARTSAAGWKQVDTSGDIRRLEFRNGGEMGCQVRVAFHDDRRIVRVGWICS